MVNQRFKNAALTELSEKIVEYSEQLAKGEKLKVCISKGNQKIGVVYNVSLAPVITCHVNAKYCADYCYDIKYLRYSVVLNARARNTAIMFYNMDEYFNQTRAKLARVRKHKYFRWHVGGEIYNEKYFAKMVETAKLFPDWRFWCYTKQYNIVKAYILQHGADYIPENFSIMFSEWRGLKMSNYLNFPVFSVVFKDEQKPTGFYCPGSCSVCLANKTGCPYAKKNDIIYVNEH